MLKIDRILRAGQTTEKQRRELGFDNPIPAEFQWTELSSRSGDDLEVHYRHTLENLGKQPGLVGIMLTPSLRSVGL